MNPKYERQLKKGVLEILVLKLLSQKKMYGYQLIIEMKQLSHEMFTGTGNLMFTCSLLHPYQQISGITDFNFHSPWLSDIAEAIVPLWSS